jgi:hypothetical protein
MLLVTVSTTGSTWGDSRKYMGYGPKVMHRCASGKPLAESVKISA